MKFFLKRTSFLVVILLITANFLLGNIVLAKGTKITDKDIGRIKTGLSLMKALVNYTIGDNTLKTALNMTIGGGEIGTNISYGLVVMTAINEMDFIDMVVSQRYKQEATAYFNKVIDDRTNLMSYWKGVGYDLPRVAMGYVTGPMAGLTLNSFSITDKIISIFTAFNVIKREKIYDGLWYYFSLRRESKESHQAAWEDAKILMGWAVKTKIIETGAFIKGKKSGEENLQQLESQFAILCDKWGTYTDSKGVTEMAKEQFREEMGQIVAEAIEKQALAEKSKELSLLSKAVEASKNFIKNATETVKNTAQNIISAIKSTVSQFNPFGAEVSQPLSFLDEEENIEGEKITDVIPRQPEEIGGPKPLDDAQDQLDDIAEKIDVLEAEMVKLGGDDEEKQNEIIKEEKIKEEENEGEKENEELGEILGESEMGQEEGQKLCEKIGGIQPTRNKVIFNEIAWMGSVNSPNSEWIELKNISGGEIDLVGWQILSKSDNIKIVFSGGQTSVSATQPRVLSGGFFLLERTGDDSAPGVKADFIYTGALKNSEETIYLFDENCRLQDIVAAGSGWPVGDNSSKRTMERRQDLGWQTSANAGGTPKTGNSGGYVTNTGGAASAPPPSPIPTYPKILISEIQITSASNTDDEFIELYNPNDQEIDISQWSIQKSYSTSTTIYKKNFETGNKISFQGYFLIVFASSTDQNLLNSAGLTHKTFEMAENNTIFLVKNQEKIENALDTDIIDMVGFGQNVFSEGNPAPNPETGKSLGRKWASTTQSYIDTDNNQNDFEIQNPTPKAQNQSSGNQAPTSSFIFSPQNPFISDLITFDASSSTDPDGQIISFVWNFGDDNSTTTNQATTNYSYSTSGVDYLVELLVVDNLGATSSTSTTLAITERPALSVVINEIAWMGTAASSTDEWIELYNNTTSTIDLAGWTLSADDGAPSITFSTLSGTTIIPALGFYLLERTNNQTVFDISADQIYTGALENEGEKLELRDGDNILIDSIDCSSDWFAGEKEEKVSMERINPKSAGSNSTNWANNNGIIKNGLDAGGNQINGTPKAQNSAYQSLPPNPVSDLTVDSQNSYGNKITLTWSSSTDPDTLSENLSYKIYYLKEVINEDNLESASTSSTTATAITIPDLDYSSTYYFGIKVFDGQNYSVLSTSSPCQTAILSTIATGFPANLEIKNNGRKISRASNGDFYVVYSRAGKIFLAKSPDQGINWTETEATPEEGLEQINPSIAIDSQNNLHLVWQGKVATPTPYQIRYRKYDGNSFSEIETLTNNSEWEQEIPVIAIDSGDNVHLVWVNNQMITGPQENRYWRPQILHRVFTEQWEAQEPTGNFQEISIASLSLAIDNQNNLHLVWQANRAVAPSAIIQYQRRVADGWGAIRQLDYDDIQADFPSLAIDNQDNLHLVWHSVRNSIGGRVNCLRSCSQINYLKYIASTNSWANIEALDFTDRSQQPVIISPSISLDFQDNLYLIWKRWYDKISQIEYSNSWGEIKNLDLGSQNAFAFTNLLWSFYPVISDKKTNQPETGFAFIFYQGTELKFYASQDLAFE